ADRARSRRRHVHRARPRRQPADLLCRRGAAMTARSDGRRFIGWVLAAVTTVVVMVNQRDVGIARDEVVYLQSGARYADWWIGLVTFHHGVSASGITRTFGGPGATDNN